MSAPEALAAIRARAGARTPCLGIVLGSGLGAVAAAVADPVSIPFGDLPGFPRTSVPGHEGRLVLGDLGGLAVALLRGRVHYYESGRADAMRLPLAVLRDLGCTALVLTNSAGSLRPDIGPGGLMAIADHINFGGTNPLIGVTDGSQFIDMTAPYDLGLRQDLAAAARILGLALPEGVYMWFSGPSFETPAEIRAAGTLGADVVGMSTVPEVILARHLGLRVAGLSLITNLAAGLGGGALSHEQTMRLATAGAETVRDLLIAFCRRLRRDDG